jgi:glycosyltransferase involved in cell wall biosynthesis
MRVCIVYDCLYPYTVGGAERWYRDLAERLVREGHEVTYLTLRQWERGERLDLDPRVRVRVAGPRMALYTGDRRRILPPLVFGAGVLWELLRHGRRYDVVHGASFPYFSLLAAALLRPLGRYELVVDWHEVWSRAYWREYLGAGAGTIGYAVQLLCARVPQRAFCFSRLHAGRLREEGMRGAVTVLRGQYVPPAPADRGEGTAGGTPPPREMAPEGGPENAAGESVGAGGPLVLFAGRLIPEKRVGLGVAAIAAARERVPGLRAVFYGEGPQRAELDTAISRLGLQAIASAPGFASAQRLERDLRSALCVLLPSRREGYGKIVVEGAACGTPAVVVAAEDNAATELIEQGVNGLVVERPEPEAIAEAIARLHAAGAAMRKSTARWYEQNAHELSLQASLERVLESYGRPAP